jgi:hypothetical protein
MGFCSGNEGVALPVGQKLPPMWISVGDAGAEHWQNAECQMAVA